MNWQDYIEFRPDVLRGKPIIKGTRLSVEHILTCMAAGDSESELIESYPFLRSEHFHAVLAFAASVIASEDRVFLKSQSG
jgi:uncharacterized protein (DUF433 family)